MGVFIVDVEVRGPAEVLDVGTDPRESLPSVLRESRPLELLSALLSRSGGGGGGGLFRSRSLAPGSGDGAALRFCCTWGDMGRDAPGEGVAPGAAEDFRGGGETAGDRVSSRGGGPRLSPPTRISERASTVAKRFARRSFAPRRSLWSDRPGWVLLSSRAYSFL